jgi:uncharacterized membrane protein HdeD (DUF308 family)
VTLVLLFGAFALVDGVFNAIAAFPLASHQSAMLVEGLMGIRDVRVAPNDGHRVA